MIDFVDQLGGQGATDTRAMGLSSWPLHRGASAVADTRHGRLWPLISAAALCALSGAFLAACGGSRGAGETIPSPAPNPGAPALAPVQEASPPVAEQRPSEPVPDGAIDITVLPKPAYIELSDTAQLVNCDFLIANRSAADWSLDEIQVSVYDRKGALSWRKFLSGNGVSPSITTIPNRDIRAHQNILLFNPLFEFPRDLELARLHYDFTFERKDGHQRMTVAAELAPVVYTNQARLHLPLRGRFLVWDGHDFYAHHRRWDYVFEPIQALGFDSNAGRYSYDFIPVDEHGDMFRGDPARNESWFGFGQPIYATAAGKVVAVVDAHPDDRQFDMEALKTNLLVVYGNYIIIDHGQGEHSMFAHIQQASARIGLGEQVSAGQEIAAIGASGSSLMPHLHYQLQNTATGHAEGLPSYFHDFQRVRGSRSIAVKRGQVDSGDILDNPGGTPPRTR